MNTQQQPHFSVIPVTNFETRRFLTVIRTRALPVAGGRTYSSPSCVATPAAGEEAPTPKGMARACGCNGLDFFFLS
jgi:hypothetical protein